MTKSTLLALPALVLLACLLRADDEKPDDKQAKQPGSPLTLIDTNGKQHKVTEWKWLSGTQRLGWLVAGDEEPAKPKEKKGKKAKASGVGPEAFVFREETAINFAKGVETLILVERLRSLTIDTDKKILTVKAATSEKDDVSMDGTTKYTNINWFSLEADVDKGNEGIASFKYLGGSLKGNVKSIAFSPSKVEPIKPGRPAVVQTLDKSVKKTHKVSDLVALYAVGNGREKLSSILAFKKTLMLDVTKIKSIVNVTDDGDELSWQVTQKGGDETTLTLLEKTTIDKQPAQLVALVGKTSVGYKIFPARRIASVQFDSSSAAAEDTLPEPDKD